MSVASDMSTTVLESHGASGTSEERVARLLSDIWVPYPEGVEVLRTMRDFLKAPNESRPVNLAIIGESNFGKSHLLKHFYSLYQSKYDYTVDEPKVALLKIEMPESPEPSALLREMLRTMCSSYTLREPVDELIWRVKVLVESLDIRLFLIDEVHNGFRGTMRQQQILLNVLRGLGNRTGRPLVIAGLPSVNDFIRNDEQLEQRFLQKRLPLWSDGTAAQRLLKGFEKELGLRNASGLASPEMTELVVRLSRGRLGYMAKLLVRAGVDAIRSGAERITNEGLQDAAKHVPSD